MPFIDLVGQRFGKWTAIERTPQKKTVRYVCRCDCGTVREVLSVSLRNGKSVSCGCAQPEQWSRGVRRVHRSTYISWVGMKQRCLYAGHSEFHRYGGRGITLAREWHDFAAFLRDMGPKPAGMSLDRIDNDGPYTKTNCRWATRAQQMANTCANVYVEYGGERFTLKQLADKLKVKYDTLHKWHRDKGLPIEQAIVRATHSTF